MTIKLKPKYKFYAADILLLYITLHIVLRRSCLISEDLLPYSVTSIKCRYCCPTSKVRASSLLILPALRN
jgi:hypothetical protein